jgi:hypothetical protein
VIRLTRNREVAPGILLDFEVSGRAIGIGMLDLRERLGVLHQSQGAEAAE